MWWTNSNGITDGPFSSEQIEKRIKLNMLRSTDRISEDKAKWHYVKDTAFWNHGKTVRSQKSHSVRTTQTENQQSFNTEPPRQSPSSNYQAQPQPFYSGENAPVKETKKRYSDLQHPSSKSQLVALIVVAVGTLVGLCTIACLIMNKSSAQEVNESSEQEDKPSAGKKPTDANTSEMEKVDFNSVKDKLVIIECEEGSGSGFLLEMDGKTYLMTNEHVVRSTGTPRARLIDGTPLTLGAFSVATDRDLARFEVPGCNVRPFQISEKLPNTGDMVAVYGNSLGRGVATESKGFIQGVGPNRLETNSEIVPGNSGSPLVATDGKVLGVAAFIDRRGSDEWTVKNTRFDGTPRRFAIRFTNVAWKNIDRRRYEQQIASLNEFSTYWDYLIPYLCFDSTEVDEDKLVFNDLKNKNFKLKQYGYGEILTSLSKAYHKRNKVSEQFAEHWNERKKFIQRLENADISSADGNRALKEFDIKTAAMFEKLKDANKNMITSRKEALLNARSVLKEGPWDAPQVLSGYSKEDRYGCVEWYQDGVQYFIDLMNQKLNDLNKEIEAIEKGDTDDD